MLQSARNEDANACQSALAAVTVWGAENRGYVQATFKLRAAIVCTLAGSSRSDALAQEALAAIPKELPENHRLHKVGVYVAQLRLARDKAAIDVALATFLANVNAKSVDRIAASLTGLLF